MSDLSPYARTAYRLRDMGFSVLPIAPGAKTPGKHDGATGWRPLPGWSRYCDAPAPDFLHEQWERWPAAGVGIAHGIAVAVDVDCDDVEVAAAAMEGAGPSPVRRRGKKGFAAYYAAGPDLAELGARVRWYRPGEDRPLVELLLHGSQSVLPPSIHPETGQPYVWLGPDTLENTEARELPRLDLEGVRRLDASLSSIGLTRAAPSRKGGAPDYDERPTFTRDGDHLAMSWGRSLNERALEPAAIDAWFPALGITKARRRGPGSWEGVATWRPSNSGRPHSERNPNLKASPGGIKDFGDERRYTPIDLVMAARGCESGEASRWLDQFVRPEERVEIDLDAMPITPEEGGDQPASIQQISVSAQSVEAVIEPPSGVDWAAAPVLGRPEPPATRVKIERPSRAEFERLMDGSAPFPVGTSALRGLLRETTAWIESAAVVWSEAGALAAAIPMLGVLMGRAWESPTQLRTNVYTVGLGQSGAGKTALVAPAKELIIRAGASEMLGADRLASGSGLLKMLADSRPKLSFLDEFGDLLQQVGRPGAGIHAAQILTEFRRLYSSAHTICTGTAYSMTPTEPIDSPHFCLFGQSTPDQFWRAFGSASLEDGTAARFIVLPLGETCPKDPDRAFEEELVDSLRALVAARPDRKPGAISPPPIRARMTEGAERSRAALKRTEAGFARYAEEEGVKAGGSVIRRVTENALKIALISAVGRNHAEPVIDADDFALGHALAWWSASVMVANIASHVADNQVERDVNDVERFIAAGGERGRGWSDVQRAFRRLRTRDLREIVDALEAQGTVRREAARADGPGRPGARFFAA